MIVQSPEVGIMCIPYWPAGTSCPPTVTGELKAMTVFSLAPARQTESKGTSLPHTSRPAAAGRS